MLWDMWAIQLRSVRREALEYHPDARGTVSTGTLVTNGGSAAAIP
jgi:hypothetical protein